MFVQHNGRVVSRPGPDPSLRGLGGLSPPASVWGQEPHEDKAGGLGDSSPQRSRVTLNIERRIRAPWPQTL
jgi:hypothetical protein